MNFSPYLCSLPGGFQAAWRDFCHLHAHTLRKWQFHSSRRSSYKLCSHCRLLFSPRPTSNPLANYVGSAFYIIQNPTPSPHLPCYYPGPSHLPASPEVWEPPPRLPCFRLFSVQHPELSCYAVSELLSPLLKTLNGFLPHLQVYRGKEAKASPTRAHDLPACTLSFLLISYSPFPSSPPRALPQTCQGPSSLGALNSPSSLLEMFSPRYPLSSEKCSYVKTFMEICRE